MKFPHRNYHDFKSNFPDLSATIGQREAKKPATGVPDRIISRTKSRLPLFKKLSNHAVRILNATST